VSLVPPTRRLVAQSLLNATECEALIASIGPEAWRPGTVGRPEAGDRRELRVRSCAAAPVDDLILLERVAQVALWANDQCFGFRLDGLSEADPPAVLRYQAGDHFAWHPDIGAEETAAAGRKLSFTLQLSDPSGYSGGDLELGVHHLTDTTIAGLRSQGMLLLFPSFLVHRVTPVKAGVRYAIVGWLHGPAFT
jgi:PKHD-type hydroxylase